MSIISAFQPQSKTVSLTADVASRSVQILPTDFGLAGTVFPPTMRVINAGTVIVWVSFTAVTGTIVIPTAGTTTVGTPQLAMALLPSTVEAFAVPIGPTLWVQSISLSAAQVFHLLAGEGL